MDLMLKSKLIRLSKSCIDTEEKDAVLKVLDKEFLGMGENVYDFEQLLSEFFGRNVVCVASGTAALHMAIECMNIKNDDEILVQSLTYVASFQAIAASGATPIACEVNKATLTLDCDDLRKRITSKTKAIMPVHYAGGVGDLEELYNIADEYGLRVIEDAAHAFNSYYKGKKVGSFGDVACFSFDGIKNITAGEGGCIVTDDKSIIDKAMDMRLLGVHKDSEKRYKKKRSWVYDVQAQGYRYHMSNIMAAIGIEQFKKKDYFTSKRSDLVRKYISNLEHCERIKIIPENHSEVSPHIFVVRVMGLKDRKKLQEAMLKKRIETGCHYQPNHLLSYFYNSNSQQLTVTEKISMELLTLPLHPDLNHDDIDYITENLLSMI